MTKLFLNSCLLALCILLTNCKTQQYTPEDFPETQITFGTGGGITGDMNCHHLLKNGQIFRQDGRKTSNIELEALKEKEIGVFFENAEQLDINSMKIKEPGDLYYFIECQEGDKVNRIIWGHPDFEVPKEIEDYYLSLCELVRNRPVTAPKK